MRRVPGVTQEASLDSLTAVLPLLAMLNHAAVMPC
jgi:hypothetical protein